MTLRSLSIICSASLLCGCYLNSVFQSAEVVEPGEGRVGLAASFVSAPVDMPARIGVVRNLDLGFRYGFLDQFLIDTKYQFLRDPMDGSLSLGFSYNTVDAGTKDAPNRRVSYGFYPTILVGNTVQDVGWYAGIRALYISRAGTEEFLVANRTLFYGASGWVAKGFVLGGFVHGGGSFRFVNEVNFLFGTNGRTSIVPTLGFQVEMND